MLFPESSLYMPIDIIVNLNSLHVTFYGNPDHALTTLPTLLQKPSHTLTNVSLLHTIITLLNYIYLVDLISFYAL